MKRLLVAICLLGLRNLAPAAEPSSSISWMAWGDAAWMQAKEQSKPLFVHVTTVGSERAADMQRIAFKQAAVAEYLAQKFVCVQVDADERPGVLAALGAFVADTQQEHGIPLNVWMSDTGAPLLGRTYLEPNDEWGKPGLLNLIERVASRQATDAQALRADAAVLLESYFGRLPAGAADQAAATQEAVSFLTANMRPGGESPAITRLTPRAWHLLVQQAAQGNVEAGNVRPLLQQLAAGPLRDAVSGAFFSRAATPEGDWPVFDVDAALQIGLAETYLAAARLWPHEGFETVADELLAWLADSVVSPTGLPIRLTTSLAAPSDSPFLWTLADVQQGLTENAPAFDGWQGLTDKEKVPEAFDPNHLWRGRYRLSSSAMETLSVWPAVRSTLQRTQRQRINESKPRSAPLGTQALAAVVLAEGGRQLGKPEYLAASGRLMSKWTQLSSEDIAGRLRRFVPDVPVTAQDVVAVMLAMVVEDQPAGGGEAAAARLARLQLELQRHFLVDGIYGFPAGTALPYREVPDLREDGVLATSNAIAVRLHRASGGRFGLAPELVWERAGRAVLAMPDEYPELLRQLAP
ncbi:MAG: DUF255 domain-containing protein [Opitutus sp.]